MATLIKVTEEVEKNIVDTIIRTFPDTKIIYLFGSAAAGELTIHSDIDLAVLADRCLDKIKLNQLENELATLLQRDVDLIDLFDASVVFRFQIVCTGKKIFSINENTSNFFEDLVHAMYFRLNEERTAMLSEIKKRGHVYGG